MGECGIELPEQAFATEEMVYTRGEGDGEDRPKDAIDESNLNFCSACFCCNVGLYSEMPACIGCSMEQQFLCCMQRACCKPGTDMICCTAPEGEVCQLGLGCFGCGIKNCMQPECSCCMAQSQMCCIVESCAFPTTAEVPCMFGMLGLSCYPQVGCCMKFGELAPITASAQAGNV